MHEVKNLLMVGGTHGNELTGIYLKKMWDAQPSLVQRPGLTVQTLLANPPAVKVCRRYVETDLNRCFRISSLGGVPGGLLEEQIAHQINQDYGPKGDPLAPDLVVDYHNSTAAMGLSLIIGKCTPYLRKLCAWLRGKHSSVHIYAMTEDSLNSPYLPSLGKQDLCVEVGPQMHGTLDARLLTATAEITKDILDFTVAWNQGNVSSECQEIPVYNHWCNLDFPRHENGTLRAMVHPSLLGADYSEVRPGDPLFIGFDNSIIPWQGNHSIWPVFISESAYYEKGIAMSLTLRTLQFW